MPTNKKKKVKNTNQKQSQKQSQKVVVNIGNAKAKNTKPAKNKNSIYHDNALNGFAKSTAYSFRPPNPPLMPIINLQGNNNDNFGKYVESMNENHKETKNMFNSALKQFQSINEENAIKYDDTVKSRDRLFSMLNERNQELNEVKHDIVPKDIPPPKPRKFDVGSPARRKLIGEMESPAPPAPPTPELIPANERRKFTLKIKKQAISEGILEPGQKLLGKDVNRIMSLLKPKS